MFATSIARLGRALAITGLFLALPAAALATVFNPAPVAYVAAFSPTFAGPSVPHAGTMHLTFQNGTVAGTYSGMSVVPDRFNDRIENITGAVDGTNLLFNIGGAMSFTGTIAPDGKISGTATMNGRLYTFVAERGAPGEGKQ